MDMEVKAKFERLWLKYFDGAEMPVCFYYSNELPPGTYVPKPPTGQRLCHRGSIEGTSRARTLP